MTASCLLGRAVAVGALAAALGIIGCGREEPPPAPEPTDASPATAPPTERVVGPLSPEDAAALGTMNDRLKEYLDLHLAIEKDLPGLPENATPEQIDANQREFERRIREARASAKPGDIFTAEAEPVILRLLAAVFGGDAGRQLKASIMDENPLDPDAFTLAVNKRYPDSVPLTTVPPEVLQTLPALTEDLEYRFIGSAIILLDAHAHVIADYIEDAIPE